MYSFNSSSDKLLKYIFKHLVFIVFNIIFSFDTINNAIIETLKIKKTSVHYVDAILSKKEEIKKEHNDDGLQNLFNQVYGKIK